MEHCQNICNNPFSRRQNVLPSPGVQCSSCRRVPWPPPTKVRFLYRNNIYRLTSNIQDTICHNSVMQVYHDRFCLTDWVLGCLLTSHYKSHFHFIFFFPNHKTPSHISIKSDLSCTWSRTPSGTRERLVLRRLSHMRGKGKREMVSSVILYYFSCDFCSHENQGETVSL